MTIETHADSRAYFHGRLEGALDRLGVSASEGARVYLLELLAGQIEHAVAVDEPIVTRLACAFSAADPHERLRRFREAGDGALHGCGFFGDHLERRGITRDYVVQLGSRAYDQAERLGARMGRPSAEVFGELSNGFEGFARALSEVREETALRTPQDIVRLLDRYRETRSPLLAQRLEAAGVFPQLGSGRGTLH